MTPLPEFIVYAISALIIGISLVTVTWQDRFEWTLNSVFKGSFVTLCPMVNTVAVVVLICGALLVLAVKVSEEDFMNKPIFKQRDNNEIYTMP